MDTADLHGLRLYDLGYEEHGSVLIPQMLQGGKLP